MTVEGIPNLDQVQYSPLCPVHFSGRYPDQDQVESISVRLITVDGIPDLDQVQSPSSVRPVTVDGTPDLDQVQYSPLCPVHFTGWDL